MSKNKTGEGRKFIEGSDENLESCYFVFIESDIILHRDEYRSSDDTSLRSKEKETERQKSQLVD